MSDNNKPRIYGFCPAGCKWETVHKDDFDRAATYKEIRNTDTGYWSVNPLQKYKIKADIIQPSLSTLSATLLSTAGGIGAATVGNKIYLFGSDTDIRKINVFDTTTETITTLSATLSIGARETQAAVVGAKIYLFGGCDSEGYPVNTINVLDTETETITTLSATLPTAAYGIGTATIGTKIYLFGGYGEEYLSDINVFDTTTETITTLSATLPTAASEIGMAAVGAKIYLFGGYGGDALKTINVFDTVNNTITTLTTTLIKGARYIAAVSYGAKIYLFGGYDGVGTLSDINVFDTGTETITTLSTTLPTAAWKIGASKVGTEIYLFGGYGKFGGGAVDTINVFTVGGYACEVKYKYGSQTYRLEIAAADEYKDYFYFEIIATQLNSGATELTLVYEVNDLRTIVYIGGTDIDISNAVLEITDANAVYLYNTEANIKGEKGDKGDKGDSGNPSGNILQETGTSTEDTMSQKAITEAIANIVAAKNLGTKTGYIKYSNGLVIQWGITNTAADSWTGTITFPIAFTSSTSYIPVVFPSSQTVEISYSNLAANNLSFGRSSSTGEFNIYWIAIGY